MFEIGVGDSSSPSGMPIRGSRDSGLDFDDVLYREAMSEMDNADDYISRDYHTDYSGRSPSIADTIEDSVSMPRKGGVQNQFTEDSRSSDQTTVIEDEKPEPDQWCVLDIIHFYVTNIHIFLFYKHFTGFFFLNYNATNKLLTFLIYFYAFRRPYDIFQVSEREFEDDDYFFKEILKGIRLFLYFFFVIIIIACIVASKLSLLLLTSGINKVRPPLCFSFFILF